MVILETNMGAIHINVDTDKAPITAKNFIDYVEDGFFDGTIFHRVIPNFMIQGGGMTEDMQQTLIIADLHLTQVEIDKIELFDQFCTENASQMDQLFILGDLFNTWIGDDISLNTYQSIATILAKLTKTTQVFVMAGNRDFLLSNSFEKKTGCKIIKEPHLLNHNEKNYLLIHGDSLCTDDVD